MHEYKIIILGTMGVGKTTAIKSIVDGDIVSTDVLNTDDSVDKPTTTVAMDYGDVPLPNGDRLRIYGSPGQERFSFLWPSLAQGAAGGIILVDAQREDIVDNLMSYLAVLHEKSLNLPIVIGITKADTITSKRLESIKRDLGAQGYHLPIIVCDARERSSVMLVVDTLMCEIETAELLAKIS